MTTTPETAPQSPVFDSMRSATETIISASHAIKEATNAAEEAVELRERFLAEHGDEIESGQMATRFGSIEDYYRFLALVGGGYVIRRVGTHDTVDKVANTIQKLQTPGLLAVTYATDYATTEGSRRSKWSAGVLTGDLQVRIDSNAYSYRYAGLILSASMHTENGQPATADVDIEDVASLLHPEVRTNPEALVLALGEKAAAKQFEQFFPTEGRDATAFRYSQRERDFLDALIVSCLRLGQVGYDASYVEAEKYRVTTRLEKVIEEKDMTYDYEALRLAPVCASNDETLETLSRLLGDKSPWDVGGALANDIYRLRYYSASHQADANSTPK